MLKVFIDGGCEPNPGGTASYGLLVHRDSEIILREGTVIGSGPLMSNNVAEYAGLLRFFEWWESPGPELIVVRSDSQMLVKQMQGTWKIKKGLYKDLALRCKQTVDQWNLLNYGVSRIGFIQIPRESNKLADELATQALSKVGINRRSS